MKNNLISYNKSKQTKKDIEVDSSEKDDSKLKNNNISIDKLNQSNAQSYAYAMKINELPRKNEDKHNNNKIQLSNNFTADKDDIIQSKLINMQTSSSGICSLFTDFIKVISGQIGCRCQYNKKINLEINYYEKKTNKLLSIDYLFKKLFYIELIISNNFSENQLKEYNKLYLLSFFNNEGGNNTINYDDTDAFNFLRKKE